MKDAPVKDMAQHPRADPRFGHRHVCRQGEGSFMPDLSSFSLLMGPAPLLPPAQHEGTEAASAKVI